MVKKQILITYLFSIFLIGSASAQEFIKRAPFPKSEKMIIRDFSGDSWLVYDNYVKTEDQNEYNVFVLFTETGTTAQVMYLPESVLQVNDFEIYDGIVYFSGYDNTYTGIMGYFTMTGFPTSNVQICRVPAIRAFNKLEIGLFDGKLHVFMTGNDTLGRDRIIDVMSGGIGQWNFVVSNVIENVKWFDDVAVLNSTIVFSGRDANGSGYLYHFLAPSSPFSIIPQNATFVSLGSIACDKILLDASSGDNFSYVQVRIYNKDIVGFCYGMTVSSHYELGATPVTNPNNTIDLNCGSTTGTVDLLSVNGMAGTWDIFSAVGGTPTIIFGHRFSGEAPRSLDAVRSTPGVFVAAGPSPTGNVDLSIYRYKRSYWSECTEKVSLICSTPLYKPNNNIINFLGQTFIIEPNILECLNTEVPVTTECLEIRTRY